jgi:hypothetical protein
MQPGSVLAGEEGGRRREDGGDFVGEEGRS